MALKSTIYKADLQIADMDRHYYQTHSLTLARHPSETDERMMVRLLAFARHADEALLFGEGIASDEEPDLWRKDLTGTIEQWIEMGQPEEKWVRKACGRSQQVVIYSYARSTPLWWQPISSKLERLENLSVYQIAAETTQAIAKLAQRSMQLQCTIQDGLLWLADGNNQVQVDFEVLKAASR